MTEWTAVVWTFLIFGAMIAMTVYRKKEKDMANSFSWRNYTKPTPPNVLMYAEFIQGILLSFSTVSTIMSYPGVALFINLMMVIVHQAVKLFGKIVEKEKAKTESVTAEFPSGEEVTVTHEKPKDEGQE